MYVYNTHEKKTTKKIYARVYVKTNLSYKNNIDQDIKSQTLKS